MEQRLPDFELRNAGVGPDPLTFDNVHELADFGIMLFLRDYHCPKCRAQVNDLAARAEEIEARGAGVIPILPNSYEKATEWVETFDLPFPLLADPAGEMGDAYDQPRRFGMLGKLHDFIGRMPKAVLIDLREQQPVVVYAHEGSTPGDRPEVDEFLAEMDEIRDAFSFDCELVEC